MVADPADLLAMKNLVNYPTQQMFMFSGCSKLIATASTSVARGGGSGVRNIAMMFGITLQWKDSSYALVLKVPVVSNVFPPGTHTSMYAWPVASSVRNIANSKH